MTKKALIGFGTGVVLGGITAFAYFKSRKSKTIPPTEIPTAPETPKHHYVDYKDEEHLIIGDEAQLDRRIIQLEKTINMRDIGGYTGKDGRKTKWGKVIRSEELNALSDNDLARLESIGLKHIYDFRGKGKSLRVPDRIPKGAIYHNIPTFSNLPVDPKTIDFSQETAIDDFFKVVYGLQVREKAQVFAEILKTLAKDETPLLYHCTNGKDRTGFMTALILLICGVPEETIISDYTLTNLTFETAVRRFTPSLSEEFGANPEDLHDFFGVRPSWLMIQLDYIRDHYENVDDYLISNTDLTADDLDAIREVMLEPEKK